MCGYQLCRGQRGLSSLCVRVCCVGGVSRPPPGKAVVARDAAATRRPRRVGEAGRPGELSGWGRYQG